MPERVLLLFNRTSGTGHSRQLIGRVERAFRKSLEGPAPLPRGARRWGPCAVLRCRFGTADGGEEVRHAVTMCGLGQFGRASGDLARWHRLLGWRRQALVNVAGIERVNDLEYVAAAA